MRVLAFTDVHSEKEAEREILKKMEDVDIAICAGDLANFGKMDWEFIEEMDGFGIPIFFVHGTHEDEEIAKKIDDYRNWHWVHNDIFEFNGLKISGYGDLEFRRGDRELLRLIDRLEGEERVLFVSHIPPFGTSLDLLIDRHVGNELLTILIYEIKPILYVCGHLHENFGMKEKILETLIINPGPYGEVIEI